MRAALALADVLLTSLAGVFAILGYRAARARQFDRHRRFMLAAFASSALFLIPFVTRIVRYGLTPFRGVGAWRGVYWLVFLTHDGFAVASVPLIVAALALGLGGSFAAHKEVGPVAFGAWLYVIATGVCLYVMLDLV
ncbi:MAG: DUF420 domain-containing protein [Deltaproteobacteria bacterium]|nr:DUF420 domain-containing protein [Deltaproteobacteria bacterium]